MGGDTKSKDLVTALTYAAPGADESGEALIKVSPALEITRKNEDYLRRLEGVDTQSLIDLQFKFSDNLPYLKLCSDERIREYFAQWNLPIESRTDLELFSQTLAERITTLARDDSGAKRYVQQKEYGIQLAQLPAAISDLEKKVSQLDAYAKPFEAVARFVYDAVVLHDFRMREHGTGALETYEGELRIGERNWTPTRTRAFIEINLDSCHRFRLSIIVNDICEEREELVEESVEKKTHWYSRKKQFKVTKSKKVSIKIGEEIVIASDGLFHYAENSGNPMTVQNYLQYVREGALEEPGDHIPLLKQFLTTFFNLPRYMHNYLIRTRNEFTDTLDAVSSELAKNDKQVKE